MSEPTLQQFIFRAIGLYPDFPRFTQELSPSVIEARGMSPKKLHEVSRLSAFIDDLVHRQNLYYAVDLGAGQGYLSHFLTTKCHMRVLAIESKDHNSHAAKHRSEAIAEKLHQENSDFEVVSMLVTSQNFQSICRAPCVLLGLHTCGDLAPISLRMATELDCVRAVVNVGCCYNLMTETVHPEAKEAVSAYLRSVGVNDKGGSLDTTFTFEGNVTGFPMSAFLNSHFPQFYLGRTARTLALNDLSEPMAMHPAETLRKFSFRAGFQWLLKTYQPELSTTYSVGRKVTNCTDFGDYVLHICAQKHLDFGLSVSELNVLYDREFKPQEKRAAALWMLRALLAPVIEHLILCDRAAYLQEHGLSVKLWQVFDKDISPRCIVITGVKA